MGSKYTSMFGGNKNSTVLRDAVLELKKRMAEENAENSALEKRKLNQEQLREWSINIRMRDEFKCVDCGATEHLHAHHIRPKHDFPDLAYAVDNGKTLCRDCHAKEHGSPGLMKLGGNR